MALAAGTRIGSYAVIDSLGAGGMGEVYRATDTNLKRQVAIKVLPASLASDPERLARFQREAEVLASLNHPHIASVYGLERGPDFTALVMELVDGDDLSERIARRPIPLDETLSTARQIAEALEAAHERGIIHRDLKPANIKVRADGTVKVLDFGLAKAVETAGAASGAARPGAPDPFASPTLTSPAAMTAMGVILGTAAYMAPEQAKGRVVDARADVWAFGCVLYEMLTGRRAFQGEDVTDTIASVMRDTPDWAAIPPSAPPSIRTLLRRCLEKDPRKRAPHMSVARLEIDEVMGGSIDEAAAHAPTQTPARRKVGSRELAAWALAIVAGGAAAWVAVNRSDADTQAVPPRVRVAMEVPWTSTGEDIPVVALSPDGSSVAVHGRSTRGAEQTGRIYVRRLDGNSFAEVPGTDDIWFPAWSRDGASILGTTTGLLAGSSELRRIDISTGQSRTIATFADNVFSLGVAEARGGAVLIAFQGQPLHLLERDGATLKPLGALDTAAGELGQRTPVFLADGRHFFYTSLRSGGPSQSVPRLRSLDSDGVQELPGVVGWVFWADDHVVVYRHEDAIFAQSYTSSPLAVKGRPVQLAGDATGAATAYGQVSAAATSTVLAYHTGGGDAQQFVWIGRDGRRLDTIGPQGTYPTFDLSRDGSRLVLSRIDGSSANLWMLDTTKGTFSRVTTGTVSDGDPRLSPDGRTVIFGSTRDRTRSPFRASVTGQNPERLFPFTGRLFSNDDWSADGRWLLYHDALQRTLLAQRIEQPAAEPVVVTRTLGGFVDQARMSHDSRWVAYNSTESGRTEVYVVPFPPSATGDRWQVSTGGGAQPIWRRDDRELYYLAPDGALMAAAIKAGGTFEAGAPAKLFISPLKVVVSELEQYAVDPDGSRFLFAANVEGEKPDGMTILTNWMSLLARTRE